MPAAREEPGRLGVYVDAVYRRIGNRVSTDRAFLLFVAEVAAHFDGLTLLGRTLDTPESADYELPPEIELVELPHYTSLLHPLQVLRAFPGTVRAMWRGLDRVDTVWVIGPNPFDLILIAVALVRRRRLALGIRQDTKAYFASRVPGGLWWPAVTAMRGVDAVYRALARRVPTLVVGEAIAEQYGSGRPNVLAMTVTLIRAEDVAPEPADRDWSDTIELLTVGRLEREKNPLLLVEALAALERSHPGRFRLTWLGRGPLEDEVIAAAERLDVRRLISLRGYVAFGPELFDVYRAAHLFVHVSLTEGVPQVIVEALANGVPVVATDVGGVRAAFGEPGAALLVPPDDLSALVAAIEEAAADPVGREERSRRGLESARSLTLQAEAERVARFLLA
jgi:glycosyltransferase involved in cell wall biosynthesis